MAKVALQNVSSQPSSGKGGAARALLAEVGFEVGNREFVVLTGPARSGKSTLLRMIAGLEGVAHGEIFLGDRRLNELKPNEREVAMVFPEAALYPDMSVRQNIALGLNLRKFSQTEVTRRVQDSAAALRIEKLMDRRPGELSTVEGQRVSIARAIARQPKVLLLDEPFAMLDYAERTRMRAEIRQLCDRLQTTVLYATRDPVEGMALADRMFVFEGGRLQQMGSPQEIYEAPANLFVAGFVGKPPAMNFIQGVIKQERDSLIFKEAGEGTIEAPLVLSEYPGAAKFAGKSLVLGIRPEEIEITDAAKKDSSPADFPAIVDFVERMGAERSLSLQTGAHTLICRGSATMPDPSAGRRVRLRLNLSRAHLFDPVSTLRIAKT